MASRQAASKKFQRVCEICSRPDQNERLLCPLIHPSTISAHYNCVLFCSVQVDATSVEEHGICGVTPRYIRTEGNRAKKLVRLIFRFQLFRDLFNCFAAISFQSLNCTDLQLLQEERSSSRMLLRYWNRFGFEVLPQTIPCRLWLGSRSLVQCEQRQRCRFIVFWSSRQDREVEIYFAANQ